MPLFWASQKSTLLSTGRFAHMQINGSVFASTGRSLHRKTQEDLRDLGNSHFFNVPIVRRTMSD